MTSFPTDCLTRATLQPNSTILAGIEACQAAANTTYCYPPNGTRICVPVKEVPFYWPTTYYSPSSIIAISYELTSNLLLAQPNTGNRTENITPYMFDSHASPIPNTPHEKTLKIHFRERRTNDKSNPMNLETHNGPTLILVKTSEWPSATLSASSRPTGTGVRDDDSDDDSDDDDDDDDDESGVHPGIIAGVVIGAILAVVGLLWLCWKGCCCCACRKRNKGKEAGGGEMGVELVEQGNGGARNGERGTETGMGRKEFFAKVGPVEGTVAESVAGPSIRLDEPPPKYTP